MSTKEELEDLEQTRSSLSMEESQHRAATTMAAEKASRRVENPEFLKQLQEADVDTDVFDWIEDEYGPVFSGAHIIGNRGEHYEDQQDLLNRSKAERMVAESTPGRLLVENPRMHALAMGIRGTREMPDPTDHEKYREPASSVEKRVIRDAMEVATSRETLAIEGRGLDAVATATVENRTVTNEEEKARGLTGKVKGVFR